jgi:hypothetical protein
MRQTRDEARRLAAARVRERDARPEQPGKKRRGRPPEAGTAHAVHPRRIAVRWIVQNAPSVPTA